MAMNTAEREHLALSRKRGGYTCILGAMNLQPDPRGALAPHSDIKMGT